MKYNINAYVLAIAGEIEAQDEEDVYTKVRQICNLPLTAPIIVNFCEEQIQEAKVKEAAAPPQEEAKPEAENTL